MDDKGFEYLNVHLNHLQWCTLTCVNLDLLTVFIYFNTFYSLEERIEIVGLYPQNNNFPRAAAGIFNETYHREHMQLISM